MKKVILSRKGYDDQYGGYPSIILPCSHKNSREMISFPIPFTKKGWYEGQKGTPSSKVEYFEKTLEVYFKELCHKEPDPKNEWERMHHVDPDVRKEKKIGAFGQSGAALGHLNKQKISEGDVFLFFGTFRQTCYVGNELTYDKSEKPFHAIWGYLEVEEIISKIDDSFDLTKAPLNNPSDYYEELLKHPHYLSRNVERYKKGNSIFVGKNFGTFKYSEKLRLSKQDNMKTYWSLPSEFKGLHMSYNNLPNVISENGRIEFRSASIGQEFVVENEGEKLNNWVKEIIGV